MARVSVEVQVDVDDIIAEMDTDDLISEIEDRAARGDKDAKAFMAGSAFVGGVPLPGLGSWESESLSLAIQRRDAETAVRLIREAIQ